MYNNEKECKECRCKRYANQSLCYRHFREREKIKKEEKLRLKKIRKESTKGFEKSLRKKLHKIAWTLQSQWIRRKDANLDGYNCCYTCDCIKHYKELDAGHFKHDRLDFDDRNLKPQCTTCNKYYSGRLDIYAERLIINYGLDWFNELVKDAWSHPGYSSEDLKKIIIDLKEKLSQLN